jgi:hypothetical protein
VSRQGLTTPDAGADHCHIRSSRDASRHDGEVTFFLRQQKKTQAHSNSWHNATSHSDDEERSVSEPLDLDPEDLLGTIEQVEETLTIMTTVVSQLKEQLMEQLGVVDSRDMSVEEFLEFCENSDGVLH